MIYFGLLGGINYKVFGSPLTDASEPCPRGTYNPGSQQCAACPMGTFSSEIGRQSVCPPCPANSICVNPSSITACPQHTVSPEGSTSLQDCGCLAGYECKYRRQVLVRMSFANNVNQSISHQEFMISQLQNNSGLIEKLRQSVVGIDLSRVLFKGFRLITT